jgi:hypothetical protein
VIADPISAAKGSKTIIEIYSQTTTLAARLGRMMAFVHLPFWDRWGTAAERGRAPLSSQIDAEHAHDHAGHKGKPHSPPSRDVTLLRTNAQGVASAHALRLSPRGSDGGPPPMRWSGLIVSA